MLGMTEMLPAQFSPFDPFQNAVDLGFFVLLDKSGAENRLCRCRSKRFPTRHSLTLMFSTSRFVHKRSHP